MARAIRNTLTASADEPITRERMEAFLKGVTAKQVVFSCYSNLEHTEVAKRTIKTADIVLGEKVAELGKHSLTYRHLIEVSYSTSSQAPVVRKAFSARPSPERDEFLRRVAEHLPECLPPQAGHSEVRFYPGRNWLAVLYPGFPSSHYELRLARVFDEVAFHFEGRREDNLACLAILEPHKEELAAVLGQPVVAAPLGSNWARLAVEMVPAPWTEDQAREYAALLARFIEATYPLIREAFGARPSHRKTRVAVRPVSADSSDGRAYTLLDQQLMQIRAFLQGRSARPSDEVLCEWVQFCYAFEFFAEGAEVFRLIVPAEVNEWLYGRTNRLAQVCRMRAPSKG